MSHCRVAFVLPLAVVAVVFAWEVTPPGSPPLTAAQPGKPEEKKKEAERPMTRAEELVEMLEKTVDYPGVEAKETKLGEELERIQKVNKVTFTVNERAFAAELMADVLETKFADPTPIPPMKNTLGTVLRQILARVSVKFGATFLIRKESIEITTERAVRLEFDLPAAKGDERLLPLVSRHFSRRNIKSCFDDLADLSGFNVVLDVRAEAQAEKDITARFLNVPVDTAVQLVADMAGLEVVRKANVFYVTTPENAAKLRKARERESAPPMRTRSPRRAGSR